jgi:hypothetical protein
MTRAQDASAFERITKDILSAQNDTSPIILALRRADISSLVNLLTLSMDDVDLLEYVPATQETTTASNRAQRLSIGHRNMIKWFLKWSHQLWIDNGKVPLDANQWNLVSLDSFNDFRISGGLCLNTSPDYTQVPNKKTDSVVEFKKGIKRDGSLYPLLKDWKHWNSWNRSVIAQARSHDISDVFNVDYIPTTPDEQALFEQKQSFAYSVLNKVVMTDQGNSFVRKHEKDFNAQAVYRKLVEHVQQSTAAELIKDDIVEYLTTMKLDSRWRGTTEGFILHWQEQFRLLEEMIPVEQHYDPGVKKRMLESANPRISSHQGH